MFENFLVPAYVLILATLLVTFFHAYATVKLMRPGQQWAKGIPAMPYSDAPDTLKLIKHNIQNLFELPIIFYVLSIFCFIQGIQDQFLIILSWCYVLLRVVHSYLHIFVSSTTLRGHTYVLSNLVLFVMLLMMMRTMHQRFHHPQKRTGKPVLLLKAPKWSQLKLRAQNLKPTRTPQLAPGIM